MRRADDGRDLCGLCTLTRQRDLSQTDCRLRADVAIQTQKHTSANVVAPVAEGRHMYWPSATMPAGRRWDMLLADNARSSHACYDQH